MSFVGRRGELIRQALGLWGALRTVRLIGIDEPCR